LRKLLLAVLGLALFPGSAGAAAPSVDYRCNGAALDSCAAWYRAPVDVTWVYNTGEFVPDSGDCKQWTNKTFSADTPGTHLTCQGHSAANPDIPGGNGFFLHIDRTGPTLTGPGLARPPDGGGWFNHPVGFRFTGSDATSGIASCSGRTYHGPDGAAVVLLGTCRDVAGNVTGGAFRINYDATPPPSPNVEVLPGNHRVRLTWDSAQYVGEVVRLGSASAQKVLYRGGAGHFVDRKLRNGHRYRYRVTLADQAGNTTSDRTSAVPTRSRLLLPADGAHIRSAPELVWKRVRHASYFNVQVLFRGRKVLSRWPQTNRLQLQESWRSLGSRHHLAKGHYCWYVWPGYGPRRQSNYGDVLGRSCFQVTG